MGLKLDLGFEMGSNGLWVSTSVRLGLKLDLVPPLNGD